MSLPEWEQKFATIRQANLLQSYDYACVICPLKYQKARWGMIRIDGEEAGLVQVLEAGLLKNMIHAVQLDRGPLWFEGYGSADHQRAFFMAFAREFPARPLRRRRILPEAADDPGLRRAMTDAGYRRRERPGYATIWLDLDHDADELRARLKGKWRNRLNTAEKAGFEVAWDWSGKNLSYLLAHYEADKRRKDFDGASAALLKALAKRFVPRRKMLMGTASLNGEPAGIVLFFLHGAGATYQTGWASDDGRKHGAHNILLWQACGILKREGIRDIDLGGVNDETAAGIKLFKEGMGGELVTYAGQYF